MSYLPNNDRAKSPYVWLCDLYPSSLPCSMVANTNCSDRLFGIGYSPTLKFGRWREVNAFKVFVPRTMPNGETARWFQAKPELIAEHFSATVFTSTFTLPAGALPLCLGRINIVGFSTNITRNGNSIFTAHNAYRTRARTIGQVNRSEI